MRAVARLHAYAAIPHPHPTTLPCPCGRYELEKALIEGKISVDDLPALWNEVGCLTLPWAACCLQRDARHLFRIHTEKRILRSRQAICPQALVPFHGPPPRSPARPATARRR